MFLNRNVRRKRKAINETAKRLQAAGDMYLESTFKDFVASGRRSFEETIRSLRRGGDILWVSISSSAVPESQVQPKENFVSPTFLEPKRMYLSGYAITKDSLIVLPDSCLKVKSTSWIGPLLTGPGPEKRSVLHIYDMALEAAKNSIDSTSCPALITRNLGFSEVFLTDLVSVNCTKTGPSTSDVSLSARDGRTLELEVDPATSEAIRRATSRTKANVE
jgi:hypothetical protein